ncbi:MAG: putative Glycosyl transferase, group 1 family [Candidatus Saccharibacteria bacterium]|nr:putative Glycosyl transferase, group 1 family [Candidatus Saccharibacteria bacterium]
MKILMLGWELPPHNSGGLGVACYQLCKALAKKDVDIEFILPYKASHDIDFMNITAAHPQDVLSVIEAGGVYDSNKYVYEDGREEWLDIVGQQALYEKSVAKMVAGREFDVIHAHDWLTFKAGLRAQAYSKCPLVLHVHSIERDRAGGGKGNPVVREIESIAFQMADRIIAVSAITKRMIVEEYDIPADKIEVVHNSIDRELMIPLDDRNAYKYLVRLKEEGWRIITNVGRLTIQKGLFNLLYAAKEVVAREPKTMFLIVGNGEQYFELIELAAELGISKNVIFTGFQRGKNWRDSFGIADLFVMPSISEPYGLTALEAIEYGSPVLISNQSGVGESIKNCLRVDSWDTHEMANQMTAVVRSDTLREELHHNAFQELMQLSWDDAAHKVCNIYDRHVSAEGRLVAA